MEQSDFIGIYVACLASYNNGILHGAWVDATQSPEEITECVSEILKRSPVKDAEEWAIHDYEGFGDIQLSEYASFKTVAAYAEFIEEHGALGSALITYFGDMDDAKEALENHYRGSYNRLEDFAQELTEETTVIPDALQYYVDYEKMARDLAINDVMTIECGHSIHVFWRF